MDPATKQNQEAKRAIQEWVDKQGHDRCWYYPELFTRLVEIYEIKPTKKTSLPPIEEFEEGCTRYQFEEYESEK